MYEKFFVAMLSRGQGIQDDYNYYEEKLASFKSEYCDLLRSQCGNNNAAVANICSWMELIEKESTDASKLGQIKLIRKRLNGRLSTLFNYLVSILSNETIENDDSDEENEADDNVLYSEFRGRGTPKSVTHAVKSKPKDTRIDNHDVDNDNDNDDDASQSRCYGKNNDDLDVDIIEVQTLDNIKKNKTSLNLESRAVNKILQKYVDSLINYSSAFQKKKEYIEIEYRKNINFCIMSHTFSEWVDCRSYNNESLNNLVLFMFVGDTGNEEGYKLLDVTLHTIITRGLRKHMKSFSLLSYNAIDQKKFTDSMLRILNHGINIMDEQFVSRSSTPRYGNLDEADKENEQVWNTTTDYHTDKEHQV